MSARIFKIEYTTFAPIARDRIIFNITPFWKIEKPIENTVCALSIRCGLVKNGVMLKRIRPHKVDTKFMPSIFKIQPPILVCLFVHESYYFKSICNPFLVHQVRCVRWHRLGLRLHLSRRSEEPRGQRTDQELRFQNN